MSAQVTDADRELFSRLYNLLGGRSSMPTGEPWEHEQLRRLVGWAIEIHAQALADQRAAADDGLRARVETLADYWDIDGDARYSHNRIARSVAARALREALEQP